MKFIGVLFSVGLICAASAKLPMANPRRNNPPTGINQHFIDFLHNERVNFPCGWPDSGIPAVEPYHIEEFQTIIESSSEFSAIDFLMTAADVTGQKSMWIDFFDLRLTGLILTFDISIETMNIAGNHRLRASMLSGSVNVPISGQGRINMEISKVRVGGTAQLRTMPGGFLNMERLVSTVNIGSVDARMTGFGLLDGAVSRMISSVAPNIVANNQNRISDAVQAYLVPALNRFINNHTMTTLVNLMADRNQNPPPRRCFW